MDFIEFVAVIKRHKLLVRAGLVAAVLVAIFSSYRLDGTRLVSRSRPTYETTAVLAIKPGASIPRLPAATPAAVTPTSTPAPVGSVPVPVDTSVASATTPTSAPGASDLDVVIDSRGLYYSALSIQTAVAAPGFAERVNDELSTMDGSISAVVPLDTNTIRLVVDGSSPNRARATMHVALQQLRPLVSSYATSGAVRYTLEAEVISGPSTPTSVSSIKGPLTATVVFAVAIVLLWMGLRAHDVLVLHNRGYDHSSRIPQPRFESSDLEPDVDELDVDELDVDELDVEEPGVDVKELDVEEPGVDEPGVDEPGVEEPDVEEPDVDGKELDVEELDVDEPGVDGKELDGKELDVEEMASRDSNAPVRDEAPASNDADTDVAGTVPVTSDSDTDMVDEMPATSDIEPDVERVPAPSSRKSKRRRVLRDLEDETPSASPR